ncbi:MAG: SulP family inorganic anion transporter [Wenzhouxiangella sp.]|nr:SulP family inorganic anion transporter [Wenzhouxiangella sp.]MCH8476705.1 SulP family inorganic anion transporter [Wenzhouxiangella sp.]
MIRIPNLRGDLFAGLTAGVVALPLALAFGVASGAGAVAGLYGAIMLGLVAALFGGTRVQISGPTGPMTVLFGSVLIAVSGDIAMAMAAVLVAGLTQVSLGMLRVGGLVRFIPYPVVSGFMSGIGAIIVLLQIAPLLGVSPVASPLGALAGLPTVFGALKLEAVLLSGLTLLIVFATPMRISRVLPSPLVALLLLTPLSVLAGFDVPVIGDIPAGLPELVVPSFSLATWTTVLVLGVTLALLGSIDSLLTSLVADSLTRTRHRPNRELIGQGLGNLACAFIGALPGAGATMRTVVNIKAGGRGRLSGVVHALFLLTLLLGAAPLATQIPLAVLAGILTKVGLDILDYRLLRMLPRAPRADVLVMITVFALTVFVDLIVAVGAGVVLSMALIIHRLSLQANIAIRNEAEGPGGAMEDRIRVIDIDGPFFFGSASRLLDRSDRVMDTAAVVFNLSRVPFMDMSAQFVLEEMVARLVDNKIPAFVVLNPGQRDQLLKLAVPSLPEPILFTDLDSAMVAARRSVVSVQEKRDHYHKSGGI